MEMEGAPRFFGKANRSKRVYVEKPPADPFAGPFRKDRFVLNEQFGLCLADPLRK